MAQYEATRPPCTAWRTRASTFWRPVEAGADPAVPTRINPVVTANASTAMAARFGLTMLLCMLPPSHGSPETRTANASQLWPALPHANAVREPPAIGTAIVPSPSVSLMENDHGAGFDMLQDVRPGDRPPTPRA